jgi:hypothetical protein
MHTLDTHARTHDTLDRWSKIGCQVDVVCCKVENVPGVRRVPVQMRQGGRRVPVQMWQGGRRVPVQMWQGGRSDRRRIRAEDRLCAVNAQPFEHLQSRAGGRGRTNAIL